MTAVSPFLTHWKYCSLAPDHRNDIFNIHIPDCKLHSRSKLLQTLVSSRLVPLVSNHCRPERNNWNQPPFEILRKIPLCRRNNLILHDLGNLFDSQRYLVSIPFDVYTSDEIFGRWYVRYQTKPYMVQITDCYPRWFSTKPLSEPMLSYCQLDP